MLSARIVVLRALQLTEEPIDHQYLLSTDLPMIRVLYNENMEHGHYVPICKYDAASVLLQICH